MVVLTRPATVPNQNLRPLLSKQAWQKEYASFMHVLLVLGEGAYTYLEDCFLGITGFIYNVLSSGPIRFMDPNFCGFFQSIWWICCLENV